MRVIKNVSRIPAIQSSVKSFSKQSFSARCFVLLCRSPRPQRYVRLSAHGSGYSREEKLPRLSAMYTIASRMLGRKILDASWIASHEACLRGPDIQYQAIILLWCSPISLTLVGYISMALRVQTCSMHSCTRKSFCRFMRLAQASMIDVRMSKVSVFGGCE